MLFELGDHADDAIANESKIRRKTVPTDEHYDDCGEDVTALDLPELTAYAQAFGDDTDSESDVELSAAYVSHFWGSDAPCPEPETSPGMCSDMQQFHHRLPRPESPELHMF